MPKKTKDSHAQIIQDLDKLVNDLKEIKRELVAVKGRIHQERDNIQIKKIKKQIDGL